MGELTEPFDYEKVKHLIPEDDIDFQREYQEPGKDKVEFSFQPLTPEQTRLAGVVTERPPDPEPIIQFKGGTLFIPKVVGSLLAAGGTGKTMLFTRIAVMTASGGEYGYFSAPRPLKTLFLCAEETRDELDRRLWDACNGQFPDNLFAHSIKGTVGPLMELKNGNPTESIWWHWLDHTITNHPGLELLLLDPKSRLYGLEENNNDHNTAWVRCLEVLTEKYNLAIWFSHHVPKGTKEITQWMGRGGGALIDACRTNMGMVPMERKEAAKYGIDDYSSYIKIAKNKINIGPLSAGDAYLKFDENGRLYPVNPNTERIEGLKEHLLFLLNKDAEDYSRNQLKKSPKCKHIVEEMKNKFEGFRRVIDMDNAVDMLLEEGILHEKEAVSKGAGAPKIALKVTGKE
jgi:replicative DNA helicase